MGSQSSDISPHGLDRLDSDRETDGRDRFPHDLERIPTSHDKINQVGIPIRKSAQTEMITVMQGLAADKEHHGKEIPNARKRGVPPGL